MSLKNLLLSLYLLVTVIACGTDTKTTASSVNVEPTGTSSVDEVTIIDSVNVVSKNAFFSLNITDSPIDSASKVVITVLSIELLKANSSVSTLLTFNEPKVIDLLTLQGITSEPLLKNIEISSGVYNEIRLVVDDSNSNSYIEMLDGSIHALKIPSGSSSGLKLKGDFTVVDDQVISFTIDFDVRQSIVKAGNSNKYLLKPVIRLVNDATVGHIKGIVDTASLTDASCDDLDVDTNNAVYVFQGADIIPDDIDLSTDSDIDPIITTHIMYDVDNDQYYFEAAYLPSGNYTLALTCNASLEDVDTNNELFFYDVKNVIVDVNDIKFL